MRMKNWLASAVAIGSLAFGSQAAQAALVCEGCAYDDGSDGTHLGLYNPLTHDFGSFHHSDVGIVNGNLTPFEDFWVFDVDPSGRGSISADFTAFTNIGGFMAELYLDGGSTCAVGTPGSCSDVVLGALIASAADAGDARWEIMTGQLEAGRYIIRVTGTTNAMGTSAYTGQLAFIPEPGTLALFGVGLLGLGLTRRRAN